MVAVVFPLSPLPYHSVVQTQFFPSKPMASKMSTTLWDVMAHWLRRLQNTCYTKTFIARNEWGAWATHWWAWQFSFFLLYYNIFYNNINCLCYELSYGCVSRVLISTSIKRFL